jgi:hypothetical protein
VNLQKNKTGGMVMQRCYQFTEFFIMFLFSLFVLSCRTGSTQYGPQEIQNLRAFAKLYGYVRFFHPSDEASRIDWDRFAIYGVRKVKKTQNSQELKRALEELFLPIAPTMQIYYTGEKPVDVRGIFPKDTNGLYVVAWQHKGVELHPLWSSSYRSTRVGRIPKRILNEVWSEFDKYDREFKGKKFKLTARGKADLKGKRSGGYIYLFAFAKGRFIFEDYMRDRPIRQNEWKEYAIIGKFSENPGYLEFGVELIGSGRMWVDDFHFYLLGKDGKWEEVPISNPGFDEVEADQSPSSWFYHGGNLFEYKVVRDGDNNVLQIKSTEDYTLGSLFKGYPKVGEVINKELDAGLFCQVPLALWSDSAGTIGKSERYPLDTLLTALDSIEMDSLTADNESVRLGDVVIVWNVMQHFYPYFDVVEVDWDRELTNTFKDVLTNRNEEEFLYRINRLLAKLQDGHARAYKIEKVERACFPFLLEWVEDRVVITVSRDTANFQRGDIILAINGEEATKFFLEQQQYTSGSSQWKKHIVLERFIRGKKGTKIKFTLKRGDEILEKEAERNLRFSTLSKPERPNIQKLGEDIYYVNLNTTLMSEINEKMEELAKAKGVIFDLRIYPRYNHDILGHLTDKSVTSARWNIPLIIYPDQENIAGYDTSGRWEIKPKKPRIKGKVVFLTSGRCISAGESVMGIVEHYRLGEIVGEATAGANGNRNRFILPGNILIGWTGMKVLKHDGSQHHLIGIQPTVPVKKTIKAIREGRDEYIEKALEIIIQ